MSNLLFFCDIEKRFCEFQNNISSKAIAYHYICFVDQHIAAFEVADEVQQAVIFEEGIGGLRQQVSFAFFFPDIDQAHFRVFNSEDILCIQRAKDSKLVEVFGLAI